MTPLGHLSVTKVTRDQIPGAIEHFSGVLVGSHCFQNTNERPALLQLLDFTAKLLISLALSHLKKNKTTISLLSPINK